MDSIKPQALQEFNNQFFELIDDVNRIFPDQTEIKNTKMFVTLASKVKPTCVMEFVKGYIITPYGSYIKEGNLDFFSNNDFSKDSNVGGSDYILDKIKIVTNYINRMTDNEKKTVVIYLQNMTELCELYYSSS